jgi:DNA-binding response OmpR family regulator
MALETSLEEAGFAVAGPFDKSLDALHWLQEQTPDLALIDALLKDGPCLPVARELRKRGVLFAIYSGLKAPSPMAPEFADVPWLEKPVARNLLSETLVKLARKVSVIELLQPNRQTHGAGLSDGDCSLPTSQQSSLT